MYGGIAFDSWSQVLNVARKRHPSGLVRGLLTTAHGIVSQRYASSDMHIQLPFKMGLFPKVLQNPSFEDLEESPGFVLRAESGVAALYEITACGLG